MTLPQTGIIQSRGLGDIIIALPIAHWYHQQGHRIVWPICREFHGSVKDAVPWVDWRAIDTDKEGRFFLETPLQVLAAEGISEDDCLYLYQYLSARPDLTDPELYSVLKFDQYKYWVSGVPFKHKWQLRDCITRDQDREDQLRSRLNLGPRYCVTHLTGSTARADIKVNWLDPAVEIVSVELHQTDSIWDWLGVLEGAEAFVGMDSSMTNLVDQWGFDLDRYWLRRSSWDLTPVLGDSWTVVPTSLPTRDPQRVDPQAAAEQLRKQQTSARGLASGVHSHVPFEVDSSQIPTDFMSALKK